MAAHRGSAGVTRFQVRLNGVSSSNTFFTNRLISNSLFCSVVVAMPTDRSVMLWPGIQLYSDSATSDLYLLRYAVLKLKRNSLRSKMG